MRLTNWPIMSLKHDDLAVSFRSREARDACVPSLAYNFNNDGTEIVSVTVNANGSVCAVPIPVTVPGTASTSARGVYKEQYGSDPLVVWVRLQGQPVTLTLGQGVAA